MLDEHVSYFVPLDGNGFFTSFSFYHCIFNRLVDWGFYHGILYELLQSNDDSQL